MFRAFDEKSWIPKVSKLAREYQDAQPFPHILLSSFLLPESIKRLISEFPATDDLIWNHHNHVNCQKMAANDLEQLPKSAVQVIEELSSPEFLSWLSSLVGIPDLLADPSLEGGGLHQITTGGYLNIHADFAYHHRNNRLRRRVNLLLYLNQDWGDDWGGELELWDTDMKRCAAQYAPLNNQAVIFTTSANSWHGHPQPLNLPDGFGRKSIALYYYTQEAHPAAKMRATQFRARPSDRLGMRLLMLLDQLALNTHTKIKQICGISNDKFVTDVLKKVSELIYRRTGQK